jgi:hypothetical protein
MTPLREDKLNIHQNPPRGEATFLMGGGSTPALAGGARETTCVSTRLRQSTTTQYVEVRFGRLNAPHSDSRPSPRGKSMRGGGDFQSPAESRESKPRAVDMSTARSLVFQVVLSLEF